MSELLNKFFSRTTLKNLLSYGDDDVFNVVEKDYFRNNKSETNYNKIQYVYNNLNKHYRNEYFYKNTILNKWLLGVHSVTTTTGLAEIRIGNAKPDFILINGKAVVYEIKTELDNLERLENQIGEYYKVFNHVSVVTYEENLIKVRNKLSQINKPIGIYILQKNNRIKTITPQKEYNIDLDKQEIFKVLRKYEYENIILEHYGTLPVTSQFKYYSECEKLFLKIDIEVLYKSFLRELKKRGNINKEKFNSVPYELKYLVYFMKFKDVDYEKLNAFLQRRN